MCKLLLASAAVATLAAAGVAVAADLPNMPVKAPVIAPAPAWSWTGCYVGGNVGGTRMRTSADLSPGGLYTSPTGVLAPPNINGTGNFATDNATFPHSYLTTNSGWEGGGQVGCNYQLGVVVLGAEGDWQWTNAKTSLDAAYAAFPNVGNPGFTDAAHTEHVDVSQKWFATARARAGFTPWDRVLVYATAGVAWAEYSSNTAVTFATIPAGSAVFNGALHVGSASSTQVGGVVGGGVEWAIANNWSVKAEYLYMWFNGFNYASPLVAAAVPFAPGYAWNTNVTPREQVLRIGVNYKFGWGGPVVARY
jgi:outer membrane immunogenic protein